MRSILGAFRVIMNLSMFRRNYSQILAALLFIATALLCPGTVGADVWQCEGRTCAVLLGGCCCLAPGGSRDPSCPSPSAEKAAQTAQGIGCPDGCGCVQAIIDCDAHDTATLTGTSSPHFVTALLPTPVSIYVAPALAEVMPHTIAARGPPRRTVALSTPSLRAPPAA